jgi:glucokinase
LHGFDSGRARRIRQHDDDGAASRGPVSFEAVSRSPTLLAADIGGTHARFFAARARGAQLEPIAEATLAVADYATVEDAAAAFLARSPGVAVDRACLAVAGPVDGRTAQLTNAPWQVDADRVARALSIGHVVVCNDFEAAAAGVDDVAATGLVALQSVPAHPEGMRVVIGAGTGLGVAYLLPGTPPEHIVAGEGGHAGFAPVDDEQVALWRFVARDVGRVSNEHVLSGAGIVRVYAFASGGSLPDDVAAHGAAAVVRRADAGEAAAERALRLFVSIFGAVAGDHALAVLATGGVYVAGGIAPRLAERFRSGAFVAAFCNKGAQAPLMKRMPVALVCDGRLGLYGAARRALA